MSTFPRSLFMRLLMVLLVLGSSARALPNEELAKLK
jgi:hypothetical protein